MTGAERGAAQPDSETHRLERLRGAHRVRRPACPVDVVAVQGIHLGPNLAAGRGLAKRRASRERPLLGLARGLNGPGISLGIAIPRSRRRCVERRLDDASDEDQAECASWRAAHPHHDLAWQRLQAFEGKLHSVRRSCELRGTFSSKPGSGRCCATTGTR